NRGEVKVPASSLDTIVAEEGFRPEDVAFVWSDTQGYETQVLESGEKVLGAGTPAWVELWPSGLDAHGGVERFIDVCRRHFRQFVPSNDLADGRPALRDIGELPKLVDSINQIDRATKMDFTDVMLLP